MRRLFAILALGLVSAPAVADTVKTSSLSGYYRNEKTGERGEFTPSREKEALANFSKFGGPVTLTMTGDPDADLKLYYKPGLWWSAVECLYKTTFSANNNTMTWAVVIGTNCLSGTFVRTEPPASQKEAGRPVKSVDQIVGSWTEKREGDRMVIRKGFESYELWHSRFGQGGVSSMADGGSGVMRASFDGRQKVGDISCTFEARRAGDDLIIELIEGKCALAGTFREY